MLCTSAINTSNTIRTHRYLICLVSALLRNCFRSVLSCFNIRGVTVVILIAHYVSTFVAAKKLFSAENVYYFYIC